MDIALELLEVAVNHELIKKTEVGLFRGYVERSPEETLTTEDVIPNNPADIRLEKRLVNRLGNVKVLLEMVREIRTLLEKRFKEEKSGKEIFQDAIQNGEKVIPYLEVPLSEDPVKKAQKKEEVKKTFYQEDLTRIIFDICNFRTKMECILIPVEYFAAIPCREHDFLSMYIKNFGTPVEVVLRKEGKYKGKLTAAEIEYECRNLLFSEISPVLDRGLQEKFLTKKEFNFIKKYFYKMTALIRLYQGVKKGQINMDNDEPLMPSDTYKFSNKVVKKAVKHLKLLGMDEEMAESFDFTLRKNKVMIKCLDCPTIFLPRNREHKRCDRCSNPNAHVKSWREKNRNGIHPESKEEIIYLSTFSLKELSPDTTPC